MADIIYADPVTEDILINDTDDVAGGEDTECECCICDCETGGPTASFTSEQTSADPAGNACCVQFTDTSEAGLCGEIVSWLWNFGDENTSTSQSLEHCYTGSGPWTVRLTVTDSSGCTDFMETSVPCSCNCETTAPTADFSYDQTSDDPCCFDFFDESTVNPSCGEIISWFWDFGDGNTSTAQNPSHCYVGIGPWDVTLTVTDDLGCTDDVIGEVVCCDCDTDGPEADFNYTQTDEDPCCFDFFDSSNSGTCGTIVSYLWDFGDGNTSTAQNPSHCYTGDGPWDVSLTVTDQSGCSDGVIIEVICGETLSNCCYCLSTKLPASVTVTFGNYQVACDLNQAAVCTQDPGNPCRYEGSYTSSFYGNVKVLFGFGTTGAVGDATLGYNVEHYPYDPLDPFAYNPQIFALLECPNGGSAENPGVDCTSFGPESLTPTNNAYCGVTPGRWGCGTCGVPPFPTCSVST